MALLKIKGLAAFITWYWGSNRPSEITIIGCLFLLRGLVERKNARSGRACRLMEDSNGVTAIEYA